METESRRENIKLRITSFLFAFGMVLSFTGCVPKSTTDWKIIADRTNVNSLAQDIDHIRLFLITIGYVKNGEFSLSGLPDETNEYFSLEKSQRFSVYLRWSTASRDIRVTLVEHGEERHTLLGREQAETIADGLQKEFGAIRLEQSRN